MSGWKPISRLPDADLKYVVFWNPCQGPYHVHRVYSWQTDGFRTDGVFSHFLILPEPSPRMHQQHDRMMERLSA